MILVINSGSSSLKFQLFDKDLKVKIQGIFERIGIDGFVKFEIDGKTTKQEINVPNHKSAAKKLEQILLDQKLISSANEIKGIGHRVVHGGPNLLKAELLTDNVYEEIKKCIPLAPLHNPAALMAIDAFKENFDLPNIVCFDTSFHLTIPIQNHLYATPYEWYQNHQVRRYGFHGISYQYINSLLPNILNKKPEQINSIIAHLGNGSSITLIKNGVSHNTSMGLTPLEGLIMGTRSGDIDPSIINYVASKTGQSIEEVTSDLNKKSGLLGISGLSSDMRDLINNSNQNERARLALEMTAKRVATYIVRYANELDHIDAICFTAGIGERSDTFRKMVAEQIRILDIGFDQKKNEQDYDSFLQIGFGKIKMFAIKTNEELMIAKETLNLVSNK